MFNFINKTFYCRISIDIEGSNSSYITNIKTIPSLQHDNMYLFSFNLDGHKDWKFMGDFRWWSKNIECLRWIKYEMGLFELKDKNNKSLKKDVIFYSMANQIELFNKLKYIKKFLLYKDFKKTLLSMKVYSQEKLENFENKNGIIEKDY